MSLSDKVIIFDLDGTLLDTSPGIFNSVRFAEKQMGLSPIEESLLPLFVGPPPKEMYIKLYGLSEDDALKAVMFHREYGINEAIFEAEPYSGITDTLIALLRKGYRIAVATLKRQSIAEKVLKNFDLMKYFETIVGMDEKESFSKKDTINCAMDNLGALDAIMIGDSVYDYIGARSAGVGFIGVLYGFGFTGEKDYSFPVAKKPLDLVRLL